MSRSPAIPQVLRLAEWPEADRAAWARAHRPGDLFDDEVGAAARWRPATRRLVENAYGAWLAFLWGDERIDRSAPVAVQLTPDRLAKYIEGLRAERSEKTVQIRVASLLEAVRVMDPDADWTWLRRVVSRIKATARPSRKKHTRMRPVLQLYRLGLELMAEAEADTRRCLVRRAAVFRDGLLIAMLAACPLRVSSFSSLRLGEHLAPWGNSWWVRLGGEQMKFGDRFEGPLPDELTQQLARYVAYWRPLLLGVCDLDNAWITQYGTPMTDRSIHSRICHWTGRRLGVPINPHLFRDCATTSIAIEDPEHVRYAGVVLQHRSPATAERFYNQARTLEAGRAYQKNLLEVRRSLTSRGKPARERITSARE